MRSSTTAWAWGGLEGGGLHASSYLARDLTLALALALDLQLDPVPSPSLAQVLLQGPVQGSLLVPPLNHHVLAWALIYCLR